MAEKTLKASPLSNRGCEQSEYPRLAHPNERTLKECPITLHILPPRAPLQGAILAYSVPGVRKGARPGY